MDTTVVSEVPPKVLEHRKYVLREFIESEREYVKRLQVAFEDYYQHIKSGSSENIPSHLKNDLLSIFSTLPEIFTFHNDIFLQALENCHEDADGIMDCFLNHKSDFHSIYLPYCKNKPTSDTARVEYDKYFFTRQSELAQKLNIEDLLIAPVQRLPKYQLLIRDLLKDTRKAHMDVIKIEEAYELMMKIPLETNNIICMSLIRGVSRARLVSHGSLWRQNTLTFTCMFTPSLMNGSSEASRGVSVSSCNMKNELQQVFLFDHRILVAATADSDGFFEHQLDIKTLNGRVEESLEDLVSFVFTTDEGVKCFFKAGTPDTKNAWVRDLHAILQSQAQMKKALLFGKATPVKSVRMHSLSIDWSDSDSSIDSMPEESDNESSGNEEGWPKQTGFQSLNKKPPKSPGGKPDSTKSPPPLKTPPPLKPLQSKSSLAKIPGNKMSVTKRLKKKKKKKSEKFEPELSPLSSSLNHPRPHNKITMPPNLYGGNVIMDRAVYRHSVDVVPQKLSMSFSPLMMRNWRKMSINNDRSVVHFPCASRQQSTYNSSTKSWSPLTKSPRAKSPRAKSPRPKSPRPKSPLMSPTTVSGNGSADLPEGLFVAVDELPEMAEQVYHPLPGQVFLVEEVGQVDVWKVKVLSGSNAGSSQWVQRNCLEEYSAPISNSSIKKELQMLQKLGVGRFSEVKLARSRSSSALVAVKLFNVAMAEEKYYRELCIGVRMRHKNLLHYQLGMLRPQFSITMDYINGRPVLEHLVSRGALNEKMVAGLVRQLLEGLHYMHSHTIFHLDIRPENLLVDYSSGSDVLKIVDYGSARHSGDVDEMLSLNYEACYNFIYVAPEVFKQISVTPGTDMWGVGLIIYIIFCGATPFYNPSPLKLIANITGIRYSIPDNSSMSEDARTLVTEILVASPQMRPSASAVLERSWFTNDEISVNKVSQENIKLFLEKDCT